jgi:hypothetical protein
MNPMDPDDDSGDFPPPTPAEAAELAALIDSGWICSGE